MGPLGSLLQGKGPGYPVGWKKMENHCCFQEHQGCLTTQDLELAGCQTRSHWLLGS